PIKGYIDSFEYNTRQFASADRELGHDRGNFIDSEGDVFNLLLLLVGITHQQFRAVLHFVGMFIYSVRDFLYTAKDTAHLRYHGIYGLADWLQLLMCGTNANTQVAALYLFQVFT